MSSILRQVQGTARTLLRKSLRGALRRVDAWGKTQASSSSHEGGAASLKAHSALFRKEVVEAVPGVYVAVGYGLANSIMLEGDDGVVIIDSMEGEEAAREVKGAFTALCDKPVKALIYTHNHADHIFGGHVMAGDDAPEVISHASMPGHVRKIMNVIRPSISRRSMRQFGALLPPGQLLNCGIGPRLRYLPGDSPRVLWPTRTFEDRLEITVAGLRLVLLHTPGETPDQIAIWMPDRKVLLPADNIYQSFPNLYAIRGTAYRDVMAWVRTLDLLQSLGAEHLVPSHTRPLHGAAQIAQTIERYRDAIQFVHDQTLRGMNAGLSMDDIIARVQLPAHLRDEPWLQEHYGRVDWSVRAIYQGYLGWFEEDAASLSPLPRREQAREYAALMGGSEALVRLAREALEHGKVRWSLILAGHVLALDPYHQEASVVRASCLRVLGEEEVSANGRNYYLTQALEATGDLSIPPVDTSKSAARLIADMPVAMVMQAMPPMLRAQACLERDTRLGFHFTDTGEDFTLHIRRGVAQVLAARPEEAQVRVSTDSTVWKELLIGVRNPAKTLASKAVGVEGSAAVLVQCLLLFRPAEVS